MTSPSIPPSSGLAGGVPAATVRVTNEAPQRDHAEQNCRCHRASPRPKSPHLQPVRETLQRLPALLTPAAPRVYEQRLFVTGFQPHADFQSILGPTTPRDINQLTSLEERFPLGGTYQIGTQLDNLNHIGVGTYYYNGFQGSDIATTTGTTKLGAENIGPIITRGILMDILSIKQEKGRTQDLTTAPNGKQSLIVIYRITVEDLKDGLRRAKVGRSNPTTW